MTTQLAENTSAPQPNTSTENTETNGKTEETKVDPLAPETLDAVEAQYFGPNDAANAMKLVQHVASKGWPLMHNFKSVEENGQKRISLENTHGIYVFTIGKQIEIKDKATGKVVEKKRVPHVVEAIAVPTLDTLARSEAGNKYVLDAVLDAFERKIRSAIGRSDVTDAASLAQIALPYTVEQFAERQRIEDQGLSTWKEYAPKLKEILKKKSMDISVLALRDCLQSAKVAEANYPKVTKSLWENILRFAIELATKEGKNAAIFRHWLDTRNAASSEVEITDGDISALV